MGHLARNGRAGCCLTIYRQMLLCLPGDVKKLARRTFKSTLPGIRLVVQHATQDTRPMKSSDLYATAHLFTAAVRVLDHRDGAPPALEAVCRLLDFSDEKGSYLLSRFKELGIVDTVKSGFNDRLVVADHLAIEDLPRDMEESRLEQELKKFRQGRNVMEEKVKGIKAQAEQKKQDLFAEIEKKLKKKMEQK